MCYIEVILVSYYELELCVLGLGWFFFSFLLTVLHQNGGVFNIAVIPYPDNMKMIFIYSTFIKGDHTYFDIESSGGVDGTKLYPELKYTTISEFLDTLL